MLTEWTARSRRFESYTVRQLENVTNMNEASTIADTATARLVVINITEGGAGMFFATCDNEPTFFIAATSLADVWKCIPCAIEYMFDSKYHLAVKAIPTDQGCIGNKPWAVVPRDLLAQKAAEQTFQLEPV